MRGVKESVSFTQPAKEMRDGSFSPFFFVACGKHQIDGAADAEDPAFEKGRQGFVFVAVELFGTANPDVTYHAPHRAVSLPVNRTLDNRIEMRKVMAAGTGLMNQYFAIKDQHKDAVLMFQVGGFYQLYYHDAELAAKELGTTRVSRAIGNGKRAPMCGFPKAGGEKYAEALSEKGYRVILCTQAEQKDANGMTAREISKVVEPSDSLVDLSAAWDDYLNTHTFEDLKPPERKKKHQEQEESLVEQLSRLDLSMTTPLEAFNTLQKWKEIYAR